MVEVPYGRAYTRYAVIVRSYIKLRLHFCVVLFLGYCSIVQAQAGSAVSSREATPSLTSQPTPNSEVELRRIALEEKRLQQERDLKQQELSIQDRQVHNGLFTVFGREMSAVTVTLLIGIITVIGGVTASLITGRQNLNLERAKFKYQQQIENAKSQFQQDIEKQKAQTELILSAIKTGDRDSAVANLLFLVDVGLLQDPSGKITELRRKPELAPVLPGSGGRLKGAIQRWAVRTASDPEAQSIDTAPKSVTLEELIDFKRPRELPLSGLSGERGNHRYPSVETSVYVLEARLIAYRLIMSGDFRLILEGGAGKTMLAAIPKDDPEHVSPDSPFSQQIAAARAAFRRHFNVRRSNEEQQSGWVAVDARVRVTGVGYFADLHRQKGVAPNGIEIHPVVGIEFL